MEYLSGIAGVAGIAAGGAGMAGSVANRFGGGTLVGTTIPIAESNAAYIFRQVAVILRRTPPQIEP